MIDLSIFGSIESGIAKLMIFIEDPNINENEYIYITRGKMKNDSNRLQNRSKYLDRDLKSKIDIAIDYSV